MSDVAKFGLSLAKNVDHAYECWSLEKGLSKTDLIRDVLKNAAFEAGYLHADDHELIGLYRSLSIRVADAAEAIFNDFGSFPPDVTPKAVKRCQDTPSWLEDYTTYVQGDPFGTNNPRKTSLNQNIGYYVKKRLGAINQTNANGKTKVLKVVGLVISNYTGLIAA